MRYRQIMLVRRSPKAPGAEAVIAEATRWAEHGAPGLLFFHGPGVAWVQELPGALVHRWRRGGLEPTVCSAAWSRRHGDPPPPGWRLGSLLQFWDAAGRAERLVSIGSMSHA